MNEVSRLKHKIDGEIVVWASFQLVRTLMEHDLVDELRLKIYPSCSGPAIASSARPAIRNPCGVGTQTVDGNVAFLTYERARDAWRRPTAPAAPNKRLLSNGLARAKPRPL